MFTIYKNALDRIKADDALKEKTAAYLTEKLVLSDHSPVRARAYAAPRFKRLAVAVCALVLLCALPISGYALYQTPVSYLSVDINPSVELGINTFGRVVSATAYNDDGKTVIHGLSLKHQTVGKAVSLIVDSASENGFIHDDGSSVISITAETDNDQKAQQLEQDAQSGAEDAIEAKDDDATVITDQIALDRRADAIALGITPGKLNLIEKLQALDPSVKTEDYKDASVKDIQIKFIELQKKSHGAGTGTNEIAVSPSPEASPSASPSDAVTAASPSPSNNGNHYGSGSNKPDKQDKDKDQDKDNVTPSAADAESSDDNAQSINENNGNNASNGHQNNGNNQDKENSNNGHGNNKS